MLPNSPGRKSLTLPAALAPFLQRLGVMRLKVTEFQLRQRDSADVRDQVVLDYPFVPFIGGLAAIAGYASL
jgi:hypothetical protein